MPPAITPGEWKISGELDDLRVLWMESDTPESCDGVEQIAHVVCSGWELTHYEKPAANAVAIAAIPVAHKAMEETLESLEAIQALALPGATHIQTLCGNAIKALRSAMLAAGYRENDTNL